jgi:hypothetical protein
MSVHRCTDNTEAKYDALTEGDEKTQCKSEVEKLAALITDIDSWVKVRVPRVYRYISVVGFGRVASGRAGGCASYAIGRSDNRHNH